jgi:hypothetical protein
MKHPSNRELFNYWNERRGQRMAPNRADIVPGDIRKILGDTFILENNSMNQPEFRLAGTKLCALFGRELKGANFIDLWQRSDWTRIASLIAAAVNDKAAVVASVSGAAADSILKPINLEMVLLPLAFDTSHEMRILGSIAPMASPYWLGAKPIGMLSLGSFRYLSADLIEEPVASQAIGSQRRHGLTVYEGGRNSDRLRKEDGSHLG